MSVPSWLSILFAAAVSVAGAARASALTPERVSGSIHLRAAFDDNVFLQSQGALGERESVVLQAGAEWTFGWKLPPNDQVQLTYAPEHTEFLDEAEESFTRHRLAGAWTSGEALLRREVSASVLVTEGPQDPITWTEAGGAPAGGAPTVRDRRDATVTRARLSWPTPLAGWLVRPVGLYYHHDFRARQLRLAGCQNSVDRSDANLGVDIGRHHPGRPLRLVGWRIGRQTQNTLFESPEAYGNHYQRLLLTWEGKITERWSANATAGPEWRRYDREVPPTFGRRSREWWFVDAALTWTGARDRVSFAWRECEMPGSSGRSTYASSVVEAGWARQLTPKWQWQCLGRVEQFDFRRPVQRDDQIAQGRVSLDYRWQPHASVQVEYAHEVGSSAVPATPGREYQRTGVSVGWHWQL